MCSCGFKIGSTKSLSEFDNFIPAKEFAEGKTNMLFRFYYCAAGMDEINKALSGFYLKEGDPLKVTKESDMDSLADLADKGDDMKIFKKSIKKALDSMPLTQEQLNKAECAVAFATPE